MTEPAEPEKKPGLLDRFRAKWSWFDHVMRGQERYNDSKGDFYAAGITYFTIFALFPLLMVGFAAGGFVLASRPELLAQLEGKIKSTITGDFGEQLVGLMDSAIDSRTSVGVIGLATAAWAGLGWMANLREALSQMWGKQRGESPGFVKTKISDLLALLSAFVAIVLTVALTALGSSRLLATVLSWLGIPDSTMLSVVLRLASLLMSLFVSWLLFTWMIARLPRESITFRSSVAAGLIAAVGFEIFKQVASIYLRSVLTGPAGATFGPVLGLMVFAYITARLVLFATAWAATSKDNLREDTVAPPPPAVINTRLITRPGLGIPQAVAAAAAGAIGALSLSRFRRR
ncbi:inner membrane protein YhjD [Mycolicibacterium komossense]|uniref:Inner membrane protein YhjD n=1 Tax=Mycolicibacterium komossense TaxID=1779 RepID=A0ABT3CCR9_9MYCO|nr:inner membrane protein YhjD [Mycolicibacterium komossense]MCV7227260.1 inner membrane protein YhjD [Mycolicibacterium komossense]